MAVRRKQGPVAAEQKAGGATHHGPGTRIKLRQFGSRRPRCATKSQPRACAAVARLDGGGVGRTSIEDTLYSAQWPG